jgi:hypothetical protein
MTQLVSARASVLARALPRPAEPFLAQCGAVGWRCAQFPQVDGLIAKPRGRMIEFGWYTK